MRLLEALLLVLVACTAAAQPAAELPAAVTLDDLLRIVATSPRVAASEREADAARADRITAGALPNPSVSLGRSRPSGGDRTLFDANSQQQATVELPIPVFGQREARVRAAERQVGRAESAIRLTQSDIRRQAALGFARLLTAQEQLEARRAALAEVERIRTLVSGRMESGMASRYDVARVDVELALAALSAQRAEADVNEQSTGLAALAAAGNWRPRAVGSLQSLQAGLAVDPGVDTVLTRNPASRVARDETAVAEARIDVANRERFPVPSISLGRSWTSGPFGAANFIGLSTEVLLLDTRRGSVDKARAELAATERRREAIEAEVGVELPRLLDALAQRKATLERFERKVDLRTPALKQMADDAYRLGRGSVLELIDAARVRVDARVTNIDLRAFTVQQELRILALTGGLGGQP